MKNVPKEEPKQDYSGVHLRHCYQGEYEDGCKYGEYDCPAKPLQEPKQENTLEEVAERIAMTKDWDFESSEGNGYYDYVEGFTEGAKWQQEKMYSEEDKIMKFLDTEIKLGLSDIKTIKRIKWYFETYFEQFKKK